MNFAEEHAESRTRDRVRLAVGEQGPVTASALAKELGLTPAAVRRHLDALVEAQLIAEHEGPLPGRRGRGRPARSYVLTPLGQDQFRSDYDDVATAALHFLADRAGEGAVTTFAAQQIDELAERLQATVQAQLEQQGAAPDDLGARTKALAVALSREGYAATARPVGQGTGLAGIQLCQGHCPVRSVATEFRDFCDAETEAISRILGVHVQRLATLAGGEHVCTTFVPTGVLGTGPPTDEERAKARPYVISREDTHPTDHPADDERSTR
ncbi:helix-turn-helix transcriptional regulator [Ornithinimicrobium panacihumi]|uniref:helix-turn-helix transcriptional regulator n=1 Tax=Ornithinimicrobium panacihumi TaxID=2008449 RepID=UPI003F8A5B0A